MRSSCAPPSSASPSSATSTSERDDLVSSYLTDALLVVRPDRDRDELLGAARAVIVSGAHVLDVVCEGEQIDEQLLDGYRAMVLAHLERVLE